MTRTREGDRLSVWRPTVKIGIRMFGQNARRASARGNKKDVPPWISRRSAGDGQQLSIGRKPMAPRAARSISRIDLDWHPAIRRNLQHVAAAIKDQALVVLRPVRRFKAASIGVNKLAARVVAGCDGL